MKTNINPWMISLVPIGIVILIATGNSCKKEKEEPATVFKYEAIQYTIDQPDGTTIILQSRGTGHGISDAFFDIYIEDGKGGVTAFRNDAWFTFDDMNAGEAVNQGSDDTFISGHIASVDSNYFLDINGGSDMGGVTYQFRTGRPQILKNRYSVLSVDTIYIKIETGGNIDTGAPDQWDNVYENSNGTLFWNGSKYVTNITAAHAYFLNMNTGEKLYEHMITEISATPGIFSNIPGYTITKTAYTYTTPKDANGGVADLGISFPVKFSVQFSDIDGTIQEVRFQPSIISEKEQ